MKIQTDINKKAQRLARLERQLTLEKIKDRKAETRRKIEWGGLVVKAKMHHYSKAVILGALLDAANSLRNDDSMKKLFQLKGESSFMENKTW